MEERRPVITPKSFQTTISNVSFFCRFLLNLEPGAFRGQGLIDSRSFCFWFSGLSKILATTKGNVIFGGEGDAQSRNMDVTLVDNVKPDDSLLNEEIFGPLLPILTMDTKEEIAAYISAHENPLALYVFTSSSASSKYLFDNTRSGGFVQNDTLVQFIIPGLPFGGQ